MSRRAIGLAVAGGLLVLAGTGCSSSIRSAALSEAVAVEFTHLYTLNQRERAYPIDATTLHTTARCRRDNQDSPLAGPGDDWLCNLVWRTPQATSAGATYAVTVRADGCFTADGDGPADLVGSSTLVDAEGETVLNPLWAFDGCLALG